MGSRLDRLYPNSQEWLDYKQIDEMVKEYKCSETDKDAAFSKAALLRAFHKYFMKYVSLLKGTIGTIDNSDTMSFLALFLSGLQKTPKDYVSIYKYIVYICRQLEEEDIYNQLVAIFIELLDKFEFYPEVSFSRYITKYMRWTIKAWIMEIARDPLTGPPYAEIEECIEAEMRQNNVYYINTELPKLDLAWVSDATSTLFSVLTTYERFLLYLNYKEGLGVRQISERLGRAKDTIHAHLQQALNKLRDQYKKGEQ